MDETREGEVFGPEAARDRIEAVRSTMRGRVRRPLWALLALGGGYALPFLAATADGLVLTSAIVLGLVVIPVTLDIAVKRSHGIAGDVLSTPRGRAWQVAWAGVFIALLVATTVAARLADAAALGVTAGIAIVPLTVVAYRVAEAAIVRGVRRA